MSTEAPTPELAKRIASLIEGDILPVTCTPLGRFSDELGVECVFVLEHLQHTGSFKWRGALGAVRHLLSGPDAEHVREHGVWTASAGNHGRALSAAAARAGIPCRVFVPRDAPEVKIAGMRASGAEVRRCETPGYDACEAFARAESANDPAHFVSAFDDPVVAAGNGGTLALELFALIDSPATVVVPVGGCGLLAGLSVVAEQLSPSTEIVGVNAERSPALVDSLREGHAHTTMQPAETLADGLEGGVGPRAFSWARSRVTRALTVTEEEIAAAMRDLWQAGICVEGSAAAALAGARKDCANLNKERIGRTGSIVVVLTGRNVDPVRVANLWACR